MSPLKVIFLSTTISLAAPVARADDAGRKQTRITVAFTASEDMVRPRVQANIVVRDEVAVTLSPDGKLSAHDTWGTVSSNSDLTLGKQHSGTVASASRKTTWHVLSNNRLVRILERPQSIQRIEIVTSGNQCTATVSDKPKPGFNEIDLASFDGKEVHYFSRREITSTSCTIE